MQTQHGKEAVGRWHWEATAPGGEPHTYRMSFPTVEAPRNCPVEGCPGQAAMRTTMGVHFFHQHLRDTVIILEEGNLPHPRCPRCDMIVPWRALNRKHLAKAQCAKGVEGKRIQMAEENLRESLERDFQAYMEPLETVILFKYMGQVMTTGGYDWPEVAGNLRKARKI